MNEFISQECEETIEVYTLASEKAVAFVKHVWCDCCDVPHAFYKYEPGEQNG